MANAITLNINGSEFWHYSARDRHGSSCTIYMVDKVHMEKADFDLKLREVAGPAALLIREHLHSHFLWGKRLDTVFDEQVNVTINGKAFGRLLHSERKFGKGPQDHTIDGEAVTVQQFREGLDDALRGAMHLVYNGLVGMHPDYSIKRSRQPEDPSSSP